MKKSYNGVTYSSDKDYRKQIDDAVSKGDYVLAGMYEQRRNAKIDGDGRGEEKTYDYQKYLTPQDQNLDYAAAVGLGKKSNGIDGGSGYDSGEDDGARSSFKSYDASKDYDRLAEKKFVYDPDEDTTYRDMVNAVRDNAKFVAENTLGEYASMTGGMPSSYAVSAASAASADVLDDINDIYAERENAAYDRYRDEYNDELTRISAKQNQNQIDYARYIDEITRQAQAESSAAEAERAERQLLMQEAESAANVERTKAQTESQYIDNYYSPYEREADLVYKDAQTQKTYADTEHTQAQTAGQNIDNYYSPYERKADIDYKDAQTQKAYADTEHTQAQTAGQYIENYYLPYERKADIAYKGAQTQKAYADAEGQKIKNSEYEGAGGENGSGGYAEQSMSDALITVESGQMVSPDMAKLIENEKNTGIYAITHGGVPSDTQARALALYGYTSDDISDAIRFAEVPKPSGEATTIRTFALYAPQKGTDEDTYIRYLDRVKKAYNMTPDQLSNIYMYYADRMGW